MSSMRTIVREPAELTATQKRLAEQVKAAMAAYRAVRPLSPAHPLVSDTVRLDWPMLPDGQVIPAGVYGLAVELHRDMTDPEGELAALAVFFTGRAGDTLYCALEAESDAAGVLIQKRVNVHLEGLVRVLDVALPLAALEVAR